MAAARTLLQSHFSKLESRRLLGQVAVLLCYAGCFTALRSFAVNWQTGDFYSLWFPAAGLRFAFLWHAGPKLAPAAALAELVVQLATGQNSLQPQPLLAIAGIVGPCLVYGGVIYFVQCWADRKTPILGLAPIPFALSAILGPIAACAAALPWALPRAMENGPLDLTSLLTSLLVFSLGDMLGVLLVAPPLLWVFDRISGQGSATPKLTTTAVAIEAVLVMLGAFLLVWAIQKAGLGLMLAPLLLATCWVGLRTGRAGAWLSIAAAAIVVLPLTGQAASEAEQIRMHMLLASIAAVGFLAGSFAEAEARSRAEIAQRNRMLYHADRLKTLRAMSVAVIHEISQPLSTIAIEAKNLASEARIDGGKHGEFQVTAELIARKARDLAQMVRRLRSFGDRAADDPSPIPISLILADLSIIAAPEAKSANVQLELEGGPHACVLGQDIELRQALLNLVRNAIAASPTGGTVRISHLVDGGRIRLSIENALPPSATFRPGMGIGLIVARSITEAHGGSIREERPAPLHVRFIVDLPLHGEINE